MPAAADAAVVALLATVVVVFGECTFAYSTPPPTDSNLTTTSPPPQQPKPVQSENFVLRSFIITCCEDGHPVPDDDIADAVQEWVIEQVDDDRACRSFTGYYNVSLSLLPPREKFGEFGVKCKCPQAVHNNFDRNCRYLPECLNGGYRSFSIDLRCVCPRPWFGPLCDKFCANGVLVQGPAVGANELCQCRENFYGDQCDQIVCFNHGTPVKGRGCLCRFPYVGMHCETELSHLVDFPNDSRIKWYSYLFGTCSSVILIILISMLVYCMFRRRRQQHQARMVHVGTNVSHGHLGPASSPYYEATDCLASAGGHIFWTDDCGRVIDLSRLPPPPTYQDALSVVVGVQSHTAQSDTDVRSTAVDQPSPRQAAEDDSSHPPSPPRQPKDNDPSSQSPNKAAAKT